MIDIDNIKYLSVEFSEDDLNSKLIENYFIKSKHPLLIYVIDCT